MMWLGEQLVGSDRQGIGQSLHDTAATPLHFGHALSQAGKESIQPLAHLRGRAEAGVRLHFLTCPVPDRFVGVKVRAVRWQRLRDAG